eukprot:2543007-Alexandrium_andersonii.AAC.1
MCIRDSAEAAGFPVAVKDIPDDPVALLCDKYPELDWGIKATYADTELIRAQAECAAYLVEGAAR